MSVGAWASRRAGKAQKYVVESHHADGIKVQHFDSKGAAHKHGMELRRAGVTAYAHPADSPWRQTKDAAGGGGGSDDQPRDEKGQFASK